MDAPTRTISSSDQISLKEILLVVWGWRWRVLLLTVVLVLIAAVAARIIQKTYRASITISAVTNTPGSQGMGGLSAVVSEFSGLASLAGLSMGGDSRKAESIAVLQSEALTEDYIREHNLLPVLYPKLWDAQHARWRVSNPKRVPTLWRANRYFKREIRALTTDTRTGLITMTIEWTDPKLAARWANELVQKTNDYLRGKAIAESERNIAYLNAQAAKTDMVGAKQAIFMIMENEINKEMIARGSEEYALKIIDPAVVPEDPYYPQPVMWELIAVFSSALLALLAAFARVAWLKG